LGDLVSSLAKPVNYRGHRIRGLHAWSTDDLALIKNICRGDFLAAGFRNRDLQTLMFPLKDPSPDQLRRRSAKVGRLLRLLRAHKLIAKVPHSHRYRLSKLGRQILPPLLLAQVATAQQLAAAVA
jgi:hypothetical protein